MLILTRSRLGSRIEPQALPQLTRRERLAVDRCSAVELACGCESTDYDRFEACISHQARGDF
jgi:hypothetical protein